MTAPTAEHPYERYLRLNPPMTADELTRDIAGTNNGYIFAPTGLMIECARLHPKRFTMRPNSLGTYTIAPR